MLRIVQTECTRSKTQNLTHGLRVEVVGKMEKESMESNKHTCSSLVSLSQEGDKRIS